MSSSRPLMLFFVGASLLAGAAGCKEVHPPQVLVHFRAEPLTTRDAIEVRYQVLSSGMRVAGEGSVGIGDGIGQVRFPTPPIPVLPKDDDTSRLFTVVGLAYRDVGSGPELFNRTVSTTGFGPGLSNFNLGFTDNCIEFVCLDSETCIDGSCRPIPFEQARGSNPRLRRDVRVGSADELVQAITGAEEGDVITLAPGDYAIGRSLRTETQGSPFAPIIVRAASRGDVRILVESSADLPSDGFLVVTPYWVFENLIVMGTCALDAHIGCDHGFHLAGNGHHVVIRNNEIVDFNQPIKSNQGGDTYPDNAIIEYNIIHNTVARNVDQYVTGVFIAASANWIVRGNHIFGFLNESRAQGRSGALDVATGSSGVTVEQNLIECDDAAAGIRRLGIAWGRQGEEGSQFCRDDCSPSVQGGVLRNNIIHCDTPLVLESSNDTRVAHNTFVRGGVAINRARGNVLVHANISPDAPVIGEESRASVAASDNAVGDLSMWLSAPPANLRPTRSAPAVSPSEDSEEDYCDEPRSPRPTVGAVDVASSCDTRTPPP